MATVKFTDEELKKLSEIQREIASVNQELGQLMFAKRMLDKDIRECETKYDSIWKKQELLQEELTKKYGQGVLNFDTGEFTPSA